VGEGDDQEVSQRQAGLAVIPVLWRAQEQNDGWVSRAAMEEVGKMLDMPYIRVYEIATFYTMFQLEPVGRKAHVQVCGTTPCMLRGSEELMKVCKRKIAEQPHTLSADGNFSWEEVECLGACVNAPMIQIWKDTYEDLTPEALEDLLDKIANGQQVKPGPQIDRTNSAPEGGPTTLTGDVRQSRRRSWREKPAVQGSEEGGQGAAGQRRQTEAGSCYHVEGHQVSSQEAVQRLQLRGRPQQRQSRPAPSG
jgi:NADH-quinone oxidoreductase subunit E